MIRRFLCRCDNKQCVCDKLARYTEDEVKERVETTTIGRIYRVDKPCSNCQNGFHVIGQ